MPQDLYKRRAHDLLNWLMDHSHEAQPTIWGHARHFDGHALAYFAQERDTEQAQQLVSETLDMIAQNMKDEAAGGTKWHLADFALHPLIRMETQHSEAFGKANLGRLKEACRTYLWHWDDLTENHNLLNHAALYLATQDWPELKYDAGEAAELHARCRKLILQWYDRWITQGSTEWGADIYYNVNLLSLFNLFDFATDEQISKGAQAVIDLFLLDEALDCYEKAMSGAARRGYGCYRMDTHISPSRPLCYLMFGDDDPLGHWLPMAPHFIGGVLCAATSRYRPPEAIVQIARDRKRTFIHQAAHRVGLWPEQGKPSDAVVEEDRISKHSFRSPGGLLSVMNSVPSNSRYTEVVASLTMGAHALCFINQPSLIYNWSPVDSDTFDAVLERYASGEQGQPHWTWVPGNQPPGCLESDYRPGYWQGHQSGPRSFGHGALAAMVYRLDPADQFQFIHAWLPRQRFDEVDQTEDNWLILRVGEHWAGLWASSPWQWTREGIWKDHEVRAEGERIAVVMTLADRGGYDADTWRGKLADINPDFNEQRLELHASDWYTQQALHLSWAKGARLDEHPAPALPNRFDTPFGKMPLGARSLSLKVDDLSHKVDAFWLASATS